MFLCHADIADVNNSHAMPTASRPRRNDWDKEGKKKKMKMKEKEKEKEKERTRARWLGRLAGAQ